MDKEYEEALREIKNANALKKEILNNVSRIPLPKGFTITFERYWTFPDLKTFKSKRFGAWLCLRQNGRAIGLLNFGVTSINDISILAIQGVKYNTKHKPPKDWSKLLTDTFLLACLPRLNKGYRLQYLGQEELIGGKEYQVYFTNKIEELKSKNISPERQKEIERNLKLFEAKQKFIKELLKTYFDKEGYLNFNRLRTKTLIDALNNIKLKTTKPKISPYKRRTLTRIKARPRLA
jgi:hypothetical protein